MANAKKLKVGSEIMNKRSGEIFGVAEIFFVQGITESVRAYADSRYAILKIEDIEFTSF